MKIEQIIRFAEDSDKKKILNLLNSVFSKQQRSDYERDEAYWNWKFSSSVYGRSILTVIEDNGRIAGVDHLWPWEFSYKGERLMAVQPCDTVVHPDYRGQGLFMKMRKFGLKKAEQNGYRIAFNFPNMNSLPGNRSLGATYLGKIPWWVRVLKPVHLVFDRVFQLNTQKFTLPEQYSLDTDYLDRLAEKNTKEESYVQIHRIPGFHLWRYLNHPSRCYGMIDVRNGNKQTAVIFTVVQKGARLELVIVDIVGDKGQEKEIVYSVVELAKSIDADFIAVMNNKLYGLEALWKYAFIKIRLKNMVILPLNTGLHEEICSFDYWSMVAGMHDSI